MKIHISLLATAATVVLLAFSTLVLLSEESLEKIFAARLPDVQTALKTGGKGDTAAYLRSMDVQIEVNGSIASTRYTMVFQNRTERELEGTLDFSLPARRGVTYFALDIDGKMREGVPVGNARGTEVFNAIVSRRVDPGLLEMLDDGNYRMRIYPVPVGGMRTVSVGYEEELTLENGVMSSLPHTVNPLLRYTLPMIYADSLEKFSITATVRKSGRTHNVPESEDWFSFYLSGEDYAASFTEEKYRPARALTFALPAIGDAPYVMMQPAPADIPRMMTQPPPGSYYFVATVAPKLEARKKRWADNLAIIWDVSFSASRRDIGRELEVLDIIFTEKRNIGVHLYFLNNKFKNGGAYKVIDGNWDELKNALKAAVFDGGTNFSQINLDKVIGNEILFFSDGISTLSGADFLKNAAAKRPVHCVISSEKADYGAMKRIAGETAGKFLDINALSSKKLHDELLNETPQFLGTERGEAVSEVYPSIATPFYGKFSVAGISGSDSAELTLLFGFGNTVKKRVKVRLDAKGAVDSENAHKIWVRKKIAELDLDYKSNGAEIMEFGQRFGIVTRNVSLIVLETLDDYYLYDITPPADLLYEYSLFARLKKLKFNYYCDDKEAFDYLMSVANAGQMSDAELKAEEERFLELTKMYFWDALCRYQETDIVFEYLKKWLSAGRKSDAEFQAEFQRVRTLKKDTDDGIIGRPEFIKRLYNPGENGTERDTRWRRIVGNLKRRWYSFLSGVLPPLIEYPMDFFEKLPEVVLDKKSDWQARAEEPGPTINIKPIKKNNDYLNKLTGKTAKDYRIYLELRDDYAYSPTFYFDMAEWFYTRGDKETALRILTSVAELDFENASLYRLLGYRLKEYGEYALEKYVCQKVVEWRPTETESYRDYALALADNGEAQTALDSLYSLFTKIWPPMYWGDTAVFDSRIYATDNALEEVLITEINRLIAKNPRLNTSTIDKRALKTFLSTEIRVPVDIRVVINWNMDSTDIDLHVKDPNGEECYYEHRQTSVGGHLSADNTRGYGPEQFLLKKAVKGKYRVYVNYYGDRRFTAAGPSTVMAEVFTKYGGMAERRKIISLQMSKAKDRSGGGKGDEKVLVAEFEF